MRRLMLLRHAKSDRSVGVPDLDRPLNPRGLQSAPRMGAYLAEHGLRPDHVVVSPSLRTRQTWEPVRAALGGQDAHIDAHIIEAIYEALDSALLKVVRATPTEARSLLLIGHNPGLQDLGLRLVGTGSGRARAQLSAEFPTAALAVIDFEVENWDAVGFGAGRLDRFVTPKGLDRNDAA